MANIYELEIRKEIVEQLVNDINLTLISGSVGSVAENLLAILDRPCVFLKVSMDGKPGFCLRVGQIQTERFTGQGLHVFAHSGSEAFLDTLEFDERLRSSLDKQGIPFVDRTTQKTQVVS